MANSFLRRDDDDWKVMIRQHKEAEDRISHNKAGIDRDAAMARELQGGGSPPTLNQSQSLPSSQPRQMNAFDRINGRTMQAGRPSSQLSQYNVKREPELLSSTQVYGHRSSVKPEPRYGSNQNHTLVKNELGYPGNQFHGTPSSSIRPPQVKPEFKPNPYWAKPGCGWPIC